MYSTVNHNLSTCDIISQLKLQWTLAYLNLRHTNNLVIRSYHKFDTQIFQGPL